MMTQVTMNKMRQTESEPFYDVMHSWISVSSTFLLTPRCEQNNDYS